ncbi:MAG: hypothetical protein KAY24_00120 [Candidatus Eisenbacteria sp.]|nr:hypothetical protein [Candidatus Eisenbacteria bacterium]
MNELETSIYDVLRADDDLKGLTGGEIRVFNSVAPLGQSMPVVVFSQAGGLEENATKPCSVIMKYQVKGIAVRGVIASQIAARIDVLLNAAILTVTGWTCYRKVRRETTVRYQERDSGGRVINHTGAVYVIWLEA